MFLQAAPGSHWPGKLPCLVVGQDDAPCAFAPVGELPRLSSCADGTGRLFKERQITAFLIHFTSWLER